MGLRLQSHNNSWLIDSQDKLPFDFPIAFRRLRQAVKPYPKAAMFELYEKGFTSVFEQLVACIISTRTYDETTIPCALRLFEKARTPDEIRALSVSRIDRLITPCTFHLAKAAQIRDIAAQAIERYAGALPCDAEVLLSFKGVGPKCAHLALGVACQQPFISVDVHVHRVTNRWGIVRTPSPEKTMAALHTLLPRKYWIEINSLLVPFGKHICTGKAPRCSTCPLLQMCQQVGVTTHR